MKIDSENIATDFLNELIDQFIRKLGGISPNTTLVTRGTSLLRNDIDVIVQAVNGKLAEDTSTKDCVQAACHRVEDFLHDWGVFRASTHAFYQTPFGWVLINAFVWATDDELITQTKAASRLQCSPTRIRNAVRDGRLKSFVDHENPRQPRRVLWNQVKQVFDEGNDAITIIV